MARSNRFLRTGVEISETIDENEAFIHFHT